ncbi:hypothetical protein HOB30_03860 [Candidatus Falkowbacteria bacterium]|jgi:hypothetical protein|nr:hypothetical protein [Candidatus Falkowbacteria bacterium]
MKKNNSILIPVLVTVPTLLMTMNAGQIMAMQDRGQGSNSEMQDSNEMQAENRQQLQVNNPETGEMAQQRQEVREKVRTQLQEKLQNQEQVRELAVGENKAMLQGGAEFSYDEETEEVTVLTPSGQEHVLVNLPDVAIEKMTESGLLDTDTTELNVELQGDEVIYSRRDVVQKKLFGIFPRTADSEVMLNDATGEISEQTLPGRSFFQKLLDRFSF